MKKLEFIKEHMLELAFILFVLRLVGVGAGIGDALALLSVVILIGYNKYLSKTKIDQTEELNKKIEDLSSKIQSIQLANGIKRTSVNERR